MINDYKRETTVKTRIIGNSHQLLRIDEEDTADIDESVEDLVYEAVNSFIDQVDVLIFQDYNKGLLTAELIQRVIALCTSKKVPMVVDPKFNNFYEYKGVTLFKPNKKEIQQAENITDKLNLRDIKVLASTVRQKLNANKIMTTLLRGWSHYY